MFDFIIKKKIVKELRKVARSDRFVGFDDMKSVLVFFMPEQYDAADAFIQQLRSMGKQVTGWTYMHKGYKGDFPETEYRVLDPKEDFDWTGEPWSETIDELIEVECDVMIDLTLSTSLPFLYLFIQREYVFKVGISKFDPDIYDLTIIQTEDRDTAFFAGQIVFYLQSIRPS
ncbi:MAG: hypothetical protein PUB21_06370 [Bacteroidales bacterium]|nr:hypothetical protein [Bacteroidales bacterium]